MSKITESISFTLKTETMNSIMTQNALKINKESKVTLLECNYNKSYTNKIFCIYYIDTNNWGLRVPSPY